MSSSSWVKKLKLALINEDLPTIVKLNDSMPNEFESKTELEEAVALTKEAITFVQDSKTKLSHEMAKLKKASKYL